MYLYIWAHADQQLLPMGAATDHASGTYGLIYIDRSMDR